jgi:hypothetical protein
MIRIKNLAVLTCIVAAFATLFWRARVDGQQLPQSPAEPGAPAVGAPSTEIGGLRLLKFSGVLRGQPGQALPPTVGITVGIFKDQEGGSPLWSETQNVALDPQGNYSIVLGATTGAGIPLDIFSSNEPRWLGMRTSVAEDEPPRLLLVGVPYALKAADADTLGGKPASAYLLSPEAKEHSGPDGQSEAPPPLRARTITGATNCVAKFLNATDVGCSTMTEINGFVGVGAPNPVDSMHVQFTNTNGSVTGYAVQNLGSGGNSYSGMLFYDQNGSLGLFQGFNNSSHEYRINNQATGGSINFMIGGSSKFKVTNSGDVGIGAATPAAKLDVAGTVKASALSLPNTAADGTGMLTVGGNRFLHNFGNSTFLGTNAGNIFAGTGALSQSNTGVGSYALTSNTQGVANTATGNSALSYNTAGSYNTAVGVAALVGNSIGENNTGVGMFSGRTTYYNAGSGNFVTLTVNTGSNNTFIGAYSGSGTPNQIVNATAIGANAVVSADNTLVLGDPNVNVAIGASAAATKLQVIGDIRVGSGGANGCLQGYNGTPLAGTCSSDERLKQNIQPFSAVLEKLVELQPVSYEWRAEEYPEYHFGPGRTSGLIAQDVEKLFPGMVAVDERGYKAVNYSQLPLLLLQALRELKAENDSLRRDVEQIHFQLEELKAVVNVSPTGLHDRGASTSPPVGPTR